MNERQLRKLFDMVVQLKSSTAFNVVLFGKEGDLVLAERLLRNMNLLSTESLETSTSSWTDNMVREYFITMAVQKKFPIPHVTVCRRSYDKIVRTNEGFPNIGIPMGYFELVFPNIGTVI